jgi:hypothetical protein
MTASVARCAARVMHVLSAFLSGQIARPHGRITVDRETRRS